MADRIWYASPNGDWWGGKDANYVFVLKESDLPEGVTLRKSKATSSRTSSWSQEFR
jgi:hypothetical protein